MGRTKSVQTDIAILAVFVYTYNKDTSRYINFAI